MNKIEFSLAAFRTEDGMTAVVVRCRQAGRCADFDTGVRVFPDEWDGRKGMVVGSPNARKLNLLIRRTWHRLEEYELDYDGDLTLERLRLSWEGREDGRSFYAMMQRQIEQRDIREGTKGIHRRVLKHLRAYVAECDVSMLTEDYVRGFAAYMREIGLSATTQSMQMRVLRCYYHLACKLYGGKVPAGSFDFYHEKLADRLRYRMNSFTDEDIHTLENFVSRPDTLPRYVEVLDRFLFMSYTGLRISDFAALTERNFTVENGRMWLAYTSVKTDTHVRIPLSAIFDGRAEQLFNKYRDRLDFFFHIRKDRFNSRLKVAVRKAGIDKRVSAHTARHTCASRLVNRDVPVTTIQKVIGHRSLKMTMVYAQTSESTLVRQLSR